MAQDQKALRMKRTENYELPKWVQNSLQYVLARKNPDYGYNFCQGVNSGAQDTYYALAIFDILNIQAPDKEETIRWLQRFRTENVFSYYYVARGITIGGRRVADSIVDSVLGLQRPRGGFGEIDVGVEAFSEFEATYMATEILSELKVDFNTDATVELLLKNMNSNGGFGTKGHSNIISTFHALASLRNLGYPVEKLETTIEYTRSCEKEKGGFTAVPEVSLPYIEDVYSGVSIFDLTKQKCLYPEATRDLILGLQNNNGGFRRSVELGLSTFQDTYLAMRILRSLQYL